MLTDGRVSADIIADGVHLDPAIVKLFAQAKGPEQTVLITDATSATGMPDGRYRLGSFEVDVRDGRCMADGKLAGSVLTMDRAVRNLARFAEWDLPQAVAAASRNPARVARIANKGVLAAGADADFVVLNPVGEVLRTFIGGVECLVGQGFQYQQGDAQRRVMAETRKFPHHLIREIFEQPDALRRTIEPRVSLAEGLVRLDEIHISREELRAVRRINIVASGTSRHAGMTGQFMMQELAGVPVDVDYASEFEYRNPMIGRGELSIFITQSGETADTTASQREARQKGSRTIAISNVEGSTIAIEADGIIYTHAGPEISIASTKAFTAQMACLFLFALYLGEIKEQGFEGAGPALHSRTARAAAKDRSDSVGGRSSGGTGRVLLSRRRFHVPGPRHPLPHRDGWSS